MSEDTGTYTTSATIADVHAAAAAMVAARCARLGGPPRVTTETTHYQDGLEITVWARDERWSVSILSSPGLRIIAYVTSARDAVTLVKPGDLARAVAALAVLTAQEEQAKEMRA